MKDKHLIILMIVLILGLTGCSKSSTNIKKYLNSGAKIDTYAKDFMPALEDLPKSQDIAYKYNHIPALLSDIDTIVLVVEYDDETYKSEKEKLTSNYNFLTKKVPSIYSKDRYFIPEYEFSMNGYEFKVVEGSDKSKAEYPKYFGMIATSDEKKSISYLYFYDHELDYIGEKDEKRPMANFVNKYFRYDF
jgi:hypothetical protein